AARWSHPAAAEGVEPPAREFAAVAEIPGAEPPALLVHGGHCQRAGGARAHAVWTGDLWRLELPGEGGARRAAWRALAAGGVGPGIRAVHDACVLGGSRSPTRTSWCTGGSSPRATGTTTRSCWTCTPGR
ncbi:unnamed protein product, partial [Prorocentrum cordatum]